MMIMRLKKEEGPIACNVCYNVASGYGESQACDSCIIERIVDQSYVSRFFSKSSHMFARHSIGYETYGSHTMCKFCNLQKIGRNVSLYVCLPCSFAGQPMTKSERSRRADAMLTLSFLQHLDPSPLEDNFVGDVGFVVEGCDQLIQAHSYILASRSPVFKAMMASNMKERNTGEIVTQGMSAAVVRAAVNFMYTGEIKFNDQARPQDVMRFAHLYDVGWLKEVCETELTSNITVGNLGEIFTVSYDLGLENLKDKATEFFSRHRDVHKHIIDIAFAKQ